MELAQNSLFKSGKQIYDQVTEYVKQHEYITTILGVVIALSIVFELIKIDTLFSIVTFLLFMFSLKELLNTNENNSQQLLYYWISLYSLNLLESFSSMTLTFMFGLFGTFMSNLFPFLLLFIVALVVGVFIGKLW